MRIDAPLLALDCDHCFMFSMDRRLSGPRRNRFLKTAGKLRTQLLTLANTDFGRRSKAIVETNEQIGKAEEMLCEVAGKPANASAALKFLAGLSGALDGLATVPAS